MIKAPPRRAENIIDTQGAGDAFLGVFVGCLFDGMQIDYAVRFANFVASKCVEKKGSTLMSMPKDREETKREFEKLQKE